MQGIDLSLAQVVPIQKKLYQQKGVQLDVLRLDAIHPVISGNKWFKLKVYLDDAARQGRQNIATFGGAYSNHIVATAAACRQKGFKAFGIIRGEQPAQLSHTLQQAAQLGMQFHFLPREAYRQKMLPDQLLQETKNDVYVIAEGGYGIKGAAGASAILDLVDRDKYAHICAAVGTGTMLAGLAIGALSHQSIVGISVLKNHLALQAEVAHLLPQPKEALNILHGYHFGGYAKKTGALLQFMNHWYQHTGIPTDFVYTGKLFYAIEDLIQKDYFPPGTTILAIHSGGLQGNASLPKGTLIY